MIAEITRDLGKFNCAWLALWICILFVPACKKIKRSEVPDPIVNPSILAVEDAAEEVGSVSDDLGEISEEIATATESIDDKDERKVMQPEVKVLRQQVPRIETERQELYDVTSSLTATSIALQDARDAVKQMKSARAQDWKHIKILQKEAERKDARIAELESEAGKASKRLMTLTALLGVVCCAVCGVLIFKGVNGVWLGVLGMGLIIGSTAASWIMSHAWISGVAVLIAIGLIVWQIVQHSRSKRANGELVASTEKIKKYLSDAEREAEFGDLVGDGAVGMIQSPTTKDIVARERARLRGRVTQFVPREGSGA